MITVETRVDGKEILDYINEKLSMYEPGTEFTLRELLGEKLCEEDIRHFGVDFSEMVKRNVFGNVECLKRSGSSIYRIKEKYNPFIKEHDIR